MPSGPETAEDVDLDPERRRFVLDMSARLDALTHYELLRLPRNADKKSIKGAYFNLVALVHPDRYYGKRLGSYKPKIEAIFVRLTRAYETLIAPDARARYDAELGEVETAPAPSASTAPTVPVNSPDAAREVAKRRAAADALKQHRVDRMTKARQHAAVGARARANQDFVNAAESYRVALTFAPDDPALKAALDEVRRAADARLGDALVRQALLQERFGRWADAAEVWKRVALAKPDDAEARAHLADALAHVQRGD